MFDSVYIYLPLSSEFPPFIHGARSRVWPGILVGHCMGHGLLQNKQITKLAENNTVGLFAFGQNTDFNTDYRLGYITVVI